MDPIPPSDAVLVPKRRTLTPVRRPDAPPSDPLPPPVGDTLEADLSKEFPDPEKPAFSGGETLLFRCQIMIDSHDERTPALRLAMTKIREIMSGKIPLWGEAGVRRVDDPQFVWAPKDLRNPSAGPVGRPPEQRNGRVTTPTGSFVFSTWVEAAKIVEGNPLAIAHKYRAAVKRLGPGVNISFPYRGFTVDVFAPK